MNKLRSLGVEVIAGSADSLETTRKAIEELKLDYDLAYDIDVDELARILGAYYETYMEAEAVYQTEESEAAVTGSPKSAVKKFLQPTAFVLKPDKTIEVAVYSSAHIGRISGKDVYTLVKYLREQEEKKAA